MNFYRDRRLFKRYKQRTDFYVIIEGNYYKAATVDFSLSGLCIFIEGKPPITLNSFIYLNIEELDIDVQGKVVWIKETDSNLLVGIEKMSMSGLLKLYPLSDIMLDLQRSSVTGTLEIKKDLICKCIYIKNGVMIFASSNQEGDHLGEVLIKAGKITPDQYYQSINISKNTGKHYGTVLIELGYLKPDELVRMVKYQIEEIILSLFTWEDGQVSLILDLLSQKLISLKLSAANLIFEGTKRINKTEYFKNLSPSLDAILYFSNEPLNLFQNITLTEEDRYVLSLLDGKLTFKEILDISSIGKFKTTKIICALLSVRMIEKKGEKVLEDKNIIKIIKETHKAVDQAFVEKVDDLHSRYQSVDYYGILNIEKTATQNQIRKAFYTIAKEFHPDRHFNSDSKTLKSKLNTIFAYINDAYKTLSDPDLKKQYDESLKISAPNINKQLDVAKLRFKKGKEAFKKGLFADAAELFGQAAYTDSSVSDYHYYLGLAYKKLKKLRDAQQAISRAIKLDPLNADYIAENGNIFLELGLFLRAKSAFEKALKLEPSNKEIAERLQWIRDQK